MPTFATFYTHSRILEAYNYSKEEHNRDYQSFLISQRCTLQHLSVDLLIQTDVLLSVRAIAREEVQWYPRLLFFRDRSPILPIFAQAKREQGFDNLALLLGIRSRDELAMCFGRRIEDGKKIGSWVHAASVANVIGIENISGQ